MKYLCDIWDLLLKTTKRKEVGEDKRRLAMD